MPKHGKKIIDIILTECNGVEDRCEGYRDELLLTIVDIITFERQHRVKHTNIQKQIIEKCNATGRFLAASKRLDDISTN